MAHAPRRAVTMRPAQIGQITNTQFPLTMDLHPFWPAPIPQ
jgi:hypothetical protein